MKDVIVGYSECEVCLLLWPFLSKVGEITFTRRVPYMIVCLQAHVLGSKFFSRLRVVFLQPCWKQDWFKYHMVDKHCAVWVYLPASLTEIVWNTRGLYSDRLVNTFFPLIQNKASWYCHNSHACLWTNMTEQHLKWPTVISHKRWGELHLAWAASRLTKIEWPICLSGDFSRFRPHSSSC